MLILSRKKGETFLIDDSIEVTVLDVQNDRVKIGINAPLSVKIVRKELRETEKANYEAAETSTPVFIKKMMGQKIIRKRID